MKSLIEFIPKTNLPAFVQNYLTEDMLLFDIETTGLSPSRNQIYCIGCGYAGTEEITIELHFAENPGEELQILLYFFKLLGQHSKIITYNGTTFDIPFIKKRAELLLPGFSKNPASAYSPFSDPDALYGASHFWDNKEGVDIFREVQKLKTLLELPSYKQKVVEQFLGCYRKDPYDGGQLIKIYHEYVKHPSQEILDVLLLHNLEDVKEMFHLLAILSYQQFRKGHFQIADTIPETEGNRSFLNVKLIPEYPLPQSIHRITDQASILMDKKITLIRLPIYHGILKHFFPDPENYYFLPEEDTAVHKSIGEYVDPSHRKKATRKNCYVKKECDYIMIPIKSEQNHPVLEYNEPHTYLQIPAQDTDSLKIFIQKLFQMYIK